MICRMMKERLRACAALAIIGLLSVPTSCSKESGSSSDSVARKEPALVPGRVVCKDPVWIGVEGGKDGKIHLNATEEQIAKLRAKWKSIALFPPGFIHGRPYFCEFDLVDPKQERPVTYTMLGAGGEAFRETDLFPITVVGVATDDSEVELVVATPYGRPMWEELPTRFFDLRFSRYPAHAAGDMARRLPGGSGMSEGRWRAAIRVSLLDAKRDEIVERYASIEVRVSAFEAPIVFKTEGIRGSAMQLMPGNPLPEDVEVSLVSITGVMRSGGREPLHLPRK